MDKQQELRGLMQEVMAEEIKAVKEELEQKNEDKIKELEDANSEQKAMIEKLQSAPAQELNVNIPGKEENTKIYKGYDLSKQGQILTIADEAKKEEIAKFVVDVIHGKTNLTVAEDATAGYLVPEVWEDELLAFSRLNSVVLNDCRIIPMSSDITKVPSESTGLTMYWMAEEATITGTNPTVGQLTLTAKKVGGLVTASNEFIADSMVDVVSWLTSLYGEALGQELDNQVFNGSQFTALLGNAGTTVTQAAGTAISGLTGDDLSNMIKALASNKLPGAKFYFHRNVLHVIRTLKGSSNDHYIFAQPGNGVPATIWEYPYSLVEQLPSAPAANTAYGVFGNLQNYILGRRNGATTLEADPYGLFSTDQTRFRMLQRWAGGVGLSSGLVDIKTKAT